MRQNMKRYHTAPLVALALAGQDVAAEIDVHKVDLAAVDGCIANAMTLEQSPLSCIDAAHTPCLEISAETPNVTTLCFKQAQDQWSHGIARHMEVLSQEAPKEIVAIARIEVKYDLLASLLQCDRMDELAALRGTANEERLKQKTRCRATASGLAFARMVWRSPMRQE